MSSTEQSLAPAPLPKPKMVAVKLESEDAYEALGIVRRTYGPGRPELAGLAARMGWRWRLNFPFGRD